MAQATLSCPFGAIHLENRLGTAQDGHWRAHIRPFLSPLAFGHLPLTRGVGPRAPIYGGLNYATKAVNAKARVAQLNGSRSMTAAAERTVTFGSCFYRWTARLLSCLGSSAAQGIGGRVIAAPTKYGRLSGLSVGAGSRPDSGRTLCAPTAENGPEALARQSQAQKWNRISLYFPPAQAPSGAGRNRTQALLILRAGRILPASRGNPRKWGAGGKANMDTECPS